MSEVIVIEIEGKEYKLGYPTRNDIKIAERKGLNIINDVDKLVSMTDMLFYTGLLAFQKDITREEAERLVTKYIEEGGDTEEVTNFLSKQYMGFIKSPVTNKKKKAKIIQI